MDSWILYILVYNYILCLQVSNLDFPVLESLMKSIVKEKQPFERLEMTKEDLLEMFKVCNGAFCKRLVLKIFLD